MDFNMCWGLSYHYCGDSKLMKLRQIKCVLAVVNSNFSMTRAAKRLGVYQPSVSRDIIQLEDYLGYPIFHRKGKVIICLTEKGHIILPNIKSILAHVGYINSTIERRL